MANIGVIYKDKDDLETALKYYEDALKIAREIGYKRGEGDLLGNIGLIYEAGGDLETALKYLEKALEIIERFELVYGRQIIQNAIGLIQTTKH